VTGRLQQATVEREANTTGLAVVHDANAIPGLTSLAGILQIRIKSSDCCRMASVDLILNRTDFGLEESE
jgi:hypothetical protein